MDTGNFSYRIHYDVVCFDKDGNLKWRREADNVSNIQGATEGLNAISAYAAATTARYLGLVNGSSAPTFSATDTLASHSGWTEVTPYSGNRPSATFGAATGASSPLTSTFTTVVYTINASATVAGAFVADVASGTSGNLFSEATFSAGNATVVSGDTLNVSGNLQMTFG